MAVKYVSEFSFPADFGFHKSGSSAVPGKARGGKVSTPMPYKSGGKVSTPFAYKGGGDVGRPRSNHMDAKRSITTGMDRSSKVGSPDVKGPVDKKMGHVGSESGGKGMGDKQLKREQWGGAEGMPVQSKTKMERGSGMQSPAFKGGGKAARSAGMMKKHMERRKDGGGIKVAAGEVPMGRKPAWNRDDASSPGSFKRTPPGEKESNEKAAKSNFDGEGRNSEPATKQKGNVERMSGFSDFRKGGKVKKHAKGGQITTKDRFEKNDKGDDEAAPDKQEKGDGMAFKDGGCIKNLGHYAHGGKVKSKVAAGKESTSKPKDGAAASRDEKKGFGKVSSSKQPAAGSKHKTTAEKHPKATRKEVNSGKDMGEHNKPNNAKDSVPMANGGLSRGSKKNAAIHAKHKGVPPGALAAIAGMMGGQGAPSQPPGPGMGPPPPGMAPNMGSPPGGPAGGMAPQGPTPGAPAMNHGGRVSHIVHHVIRHG